jgi:hypothetical protein
MGLGNRFAGDPTLETKSLDYRHCNSQDQMNATARDNPMGEKTANKRVSI